MKLLLFLVIGGTQSLHLDQSLHLNLGSSFNVSSFTVSGSLSFELDHTAGVVGNPNFTNTMRTWVSQTANVSESDVTSINIEANTRNMKLAQGLKANEVTVQFTIRGNTIEDVEIIRGQLQNAQSDLALITTQVQAALDALPGGNPPYIVTQVTITVIQPPSSNDDPHCTNIKGQKFDIYATGNMTMVKVPNKTGEKLEVRVAIKRAGHSQCAQTFIEQVNITSNLFGKNMDVEIIPGPNGHPVDTSKGEDKNFTKVRNDTLAVLLGNITVDLRQRLSGIYKVAYLNMNITGLWEAFGDDIGGLLGYGDHEYVTHRNKACLKIQQKRKTHRRAKPQANGVISALYPIDTSSKMISAATAN